MGIYFFLTQTTTFIFGSRTARTPFIAPYSLEVRMELPAFLPVVAPAAPRCPYSDGQFFDWAEWPVIAPFGEDKWGSMPWCFR